MKRILGWAAWALTRKKAQMRVMNRVMRDKFSHYDHVMSTYRNRLAMNSPTQTIGAPVKIALITLLLLCLGFGCGKKESTKPQEKASSPTAVQALNKGQLNNDPKPDTKIQNDIDKAALIIKKEWGGIKDLDEKEAEEVLDKVRTGPGVGRVFRLGAVSQDGGTKNQGQTLQMDIRQNAMMLRRLRPGSSAHRALVYQQKQNITKSNLFQLQAMAEKIKEHPDIIGKNIARSSLWNTAFRMGIYAREHGLSFDIGKLDQMFIDHFASGDRNSISAVNWIDIYQVFEAQIPHFVATGNTGGLEFLAEHGFEEAAYRLGMMYANVDSAKKNEQEAVKWLHKAALRNHPQAQLHIGHMFANGKGAKRDMVTAYAWYKIAAAFGNSKPEELIKSRRNSLNQDQIVKADALSNEILNWIRRNLRSLTRQGDRAACFRLGKMHHFGAGVKRDLPIAFAWYAITSGRAYKDASKNISVILNEMTSEQIIKADALSEKMRIDLSVAKTTLAAENGDIKSQFDLANIYLSTATGGHPSTVKMFVKVYAYAWLNIASANGDAKAKATKESLAKEMAPEQITEAEALAVDLKKMIEANKENKNP
jgi:hypothetical protein